MFKIYYTDPITNWAHAHDVETLVEALQHTEGFRKLGMTYVTMVAEDPNQVGKPGVAGVKDSKLPNGDEYTYTKRDALSQRTKNLTDELEVKLDDE
jgi:hypothetical protein